MRRRLWPPLAVNSVNASTTYGSHGIVDDRPADFGNPRTAAPTQIGRRSLDGALSR